MSLLIVVICLSWWLFVPDIINLLGYNNKPKLKVYDRWVDLQLNKTYREWVIHAGYKDNS